MFVRLNSVKAKQWANERIKTMSNNLNTGMTPEQLQKEFEKIQKRNAELEEKLKKQSTVSCKVSQKGALSIYGFGKFPFTFYLSQWDKLMENLDGIKAFVEAHKSEFSVKD